MTPLSAPSTLHQNILRNALSLVSRHSFTRAALLDSINQLPRRESSLQSSETLLESLFGTGVEPEKSLVREWEAQGLSSMKAAFGGEREGSDGAVAVTTGKGKGKAQKQLDFDALKRALVARIRWSSEMAGEHLVQAHALLATPSHQLSTSLPRPFTALASVIGSKLRLDPLYTPPSSNEPPATIQQTRNATYPKTLAPSITLPLVNPLPMLSYAIKIADEALYVSGAEPETISGELDWYTRRLGLALIYLHAETHLLHPRPPYASPSADPQLPAALAQLDASISRYRALSAAGGRLAEVEKEMGQFAWFVWKSWGGLFRSRGWIN